MINLDEIKQKLILEGLHEDEAEAKVCQDIILFLLSQSRFSRKITIKGGVVMRSITHNSRRTTVDIDLDFIKYPLTNEKIEQFISILSGKEGIKLQIKNKIEELKHQDYHGKRVYLDVADTFGNFLTTKIDIGVNKFMSLDQEEYCFDISFIDKGVSLLINSKEQILTEKLKSLLRFGSFSTRYKDFFDIAYLIDTVDKTKLLESMNELIFDDESIKERSIKDIQKRLKSIFNNTNYYNRLKESRTNWLEVSLDETINKIINYFASFNTQHN